MSARRRGRSVVRVALATVLLLVGTATACSGQDRPVPADERVDPTDWTFHMVAYDEEATDDRANWDGTFRVLEGNRVEGAGVFRQVAERHCFTIDQSGSFRISGTLEDGHFHLTASDYGPPVGEPTMNEDDARCMLVGLAEAGMLLLQLGRRLEANRNRPGPVRIEAADGKQGNYGGIIATIRIAGGQDPDRERPATTSGGSR